MRRSLSLPTALVVAAVWTLLTVPAPAAAPFSLASLLDEMVDRAALAQWPSPAYTCRQASSYDRAAKSPTEHWFANGDANQFLRQETNEGRPEWVLLDAAGPGAVVRIWSANPPEGANLRFYLDGASSATWTVPFQALTNGSGPVGQPLAAERSRGWNCYLPIPYARHLKLTADKRGFYYQVNYRTYAAGSAVSSFSPAALQAAQAQVAQVNQTLAAPVALPTGSGLKRYALAAGEAREILARDLPGAVTGLAVKLTAADRDQALRSTVLVAEFDGQPCVWAPVGDFFGSGVGVNVFQDWWRAVQADGTMLCRWTMPFARRARLRLVNLGRQPVDAAVRVVTGPWTWDQRSLHFRADWRAEYPLNTRPMIDWNYLTATGQGVYAGDSLAVMNPVGAWWGEGDEKIYTDGETFPSHFGTGTEDYYGYAWCCPEPFTGPFHAQPRCDGPGNFGHTTVSRVRLLDGIPFERDLRFDMEVWHWAACEVAYAVTTYWYARPGASDTIPPAPEQARRKLPQPPPPFKRANHTEAEAMTIAALADGLPHERQGTAGYQQDGWSENYHLWVKGRQAGDFLELRCPATPGAHKLTLYLTRSWDYGIVNVSLNGKLVAEKVDLYSEKVVATGPIVLGTHAPVDGAYRLRIEVVGRNPASKGSGAYLGIDGLQVE
ncbi:MAG: DUF2961 domain-containing protein [Fimbriimonadaceae bacterium]|nr:DUF2961 domain-containing protein [Fimbriimonadaceae bacterium]